MNLSFQKLPNSGIELKIEIPVKDFNEFIEKAVFDLGKDLEAEGFRRGKAPKEIIEKNISQGNILERAAEIAIRENYIKAICQLAEDNKIEAIGQPEIEIQVLARGNPFIFKAKTTVLPEVILPDYRKIAFDCQKQKVSISGQELSEAMLWLQKSRAKFSVLNRPCQLGDFVEIEYSSLEIEDGREVKDGFILGEGGFLPGFEEKVEGMEAGQEKNFLLKIPENYSKQDLAGKELHFYLKLNSVQKMELPELTDEFAKGLGNFENLNGLKENIKDGLMQEKEAGEKNRLRQEILSQIAAKTSLELPEVLIKGEKTQMLKELKERVSQIFKIPFEDYLTKIKKSEKELLDSFDPESKKRLKTSLILREIAKKEEISVSDGEVQAAVNGFLKDYPAEKTKELDLEKLNSYYEGVIREEKALAKLESFIITNPKNL